MGTYSWGHTGVVTFVQVEGAVVIIVSVGGDTLRTSVLDHRTSDQLKRAVENTLCVGGRRRSQKLRLRALTTPNGPIADLLCKRVALWTRISVMTSIVLSKGVIHHSSWCAEISCSSHGNDTPLQLGAVPTARG